MSKHVQLFFYRLHNEGGRGIKFQFMKNKHNLQLCVIRSDLLCVSYISRSPVTHKMAPWVQRIFIEFLPKLLCIQRPKKEDEPQEVEEQPPEVLTDVFHVPPDVEKYSPFCTNKYSTDFDIPGELSTMLDSLLTLITVLRLLREKIFWGE